MSRLHAHELDPAHDVVDFLAPGEDVDLATCDREPIHLPGAIQPHGVLLAVGEHDLRVRRTSANCAAHLGVAPEALLGAPLARALGAETVERLVRALEDPRASGADPLVLHVPGGAPYEATWHRTDGLVVLELEPAEDGGVVAMSTLFEDVRHATEALQTAGDVQALCEAAATEVRRLTGYARVMVYRFHPDEHGEVVAEARDEALDPYLGLHYPASDIPRQARKLYLLNHLRVVADVDYAPVPLLAPAQEGAPGPLNLSFAGLRSVSPLHLQYLRNMGVQATLTISLMRGTRLWGMLACHHPEPKRVGAQLRAACRLLGQLFSLQVVAKEDHERYAYRARLAEVEAQLVARMSGADQLAEALAGAGDAPLRLTAADGVVARIDGRTVTAGQVPAPATVEALLARVRTEDDGGPFVSDDVPRRFAELAGVTDHACGVLGVPLSAGWGDAVLWFRGELVRTVTWAGDPEKPVAAAPAPGAPEAVQIRPRESFAAWSQEVRGRSRPWLEAEVEAAQGLAAAIPDLLVARARDRLAHLALHDALTGLPNRALLADRVAQALARPRRAHREVALLFIDLDRFKQVNDSLGHAAGDSLLLQAAGRLTDAMREADTIARLGGDEFVVLCEDVSPEQAHRLADRVVAAFRAPFALEDEQATVTASVGVAVAAPGATAADLLRDADTAMYRAKHGGRNAAAPFTPELPGPEIGRAELETALRRALERRELALHVQPIHAADGLLRGFEALARWPLAGRGVVPPAAFVPVAEASGLITPLTAWALDEGLEALARWRALRPELDLGLSVNVSAAQIAVGGLPHQVADALRRHRVPAAALCLEITESALVADDPRTERFLDELRAQGVELSIDDFGTGWSSLAYLTKLPVQELKIDRAFIAGLPARDGDAAVVASVVGLAHQLGLRTVAEGVETDEQLATVRRLGCDLAQGYLLGRPVPVAEAGRLLAAGALARAA